MQGQLMIQAKAVITELIEKAKLKAGNIVVIGCSASEIVGSKIGTNSSPDTAKEVFEAIYEVIQEKSVPCGTVLRAFEPCHCSRAAGSAIC